MYIIIVGGGDIGYYLARALLDEKHEVAVVEKDAARCQRIVDTMGAVCIHGDGCEAVTLAEIGTARADMFIAVTDGDDDNLVACQLAKFKFGVPRTVSRLTNPKNEVLFKKLGIDVTVSSTSLILEHIELEVPSHPLTHLLTLRDLGLEIVEVRVLPHSPVIGKKVKDAGLPLGCLVCLLVRKGQKPFVPGDDAVLQAEDQLLVVTKPDQETLLREALAAASDEGQ